MSPEREPLLRGIPSEDDLSRMYWELAALGAPASGEKRDWPYAPGSREELLCLAADMTRYDARLLTILVSWLAAAWDRLDPLVLRRTMARMRSPQSLGVVLTFLRGASSDDELRRFVDYVIGGWPRVEPVERFFFDLERPHTQLAERRLGRTLAQYARWGFVATERPQIDVFQKRAIGHYGPDARLDLLRRLGRRRGELRIQEYLAELDGAVSRHQAVLDAHAAGLLQKGKKRGARWVWPRAGIQVLLRRGDVQVRERSPGRDRSVHLEAPRRARVLGEPDAEGWVRLEVGRSKWRVRARDLRVAEAADSGKPDPDGKRIAASRRGDRAPAARAAR